MHGTHFLFDVLVLLTAAVGIVVVFRSLRLSPVLGYLVAGAAIGSYGFNIIQDINPAIGEVGVVFLLFVIGLELSLQRLRELRSYVFGFGTLQVALTAGLIGSVVWYFSGNPAVAIILGGGLAFSSTAVVLQVLAERGEQSTQVGRLALATLLLQDFAVVPLLVLVPLLADLDAVSIWPAIGNAAKQAVIVLGVMFIAGRILLRPLFRLIVRTRSRELFVATTLLIVLGASYASEQAGLSLAMGAFLAGLLVAETEYQHQVEADILPFKGLFLSLFFMTIGMSIDLHLVIVQWPLVLGLSLFIMLCKILVMFVLSRLFHFTAGRALQAGLLMAQGSEFAFVLFGLAHLNGIFDDFIAQMLFVVVSITMAMTPMLHGLGTMMGEWIDRRNRRGEHNHLSEETADLDHHTIIVGLGGKGNIISKMLDEAKQRYVILDATPQNVSRGRKAGKPVYYGDASRVDILRSIGADRADTLLITFSGTQRVGKMVRAIHQAFPHLSIIVRADGMEEATILKSLGARVVITETLESGLQVGGALLRSRGVPDEEIGRIWECMRDRDR